MIHGFENGIRVNLGNSEADAFYVHRSVDRVVGLLEYTFTGGIDPVLTLYTMGKSIEHFQYRAATGLGLNIRRLDTDHCIRLKIDELAPHHVDSLNVANITLTDTKMLVDLYPQNANAGLLGSVLAAAVLGFSTVANSENCEAVTKTLLEFIEEK